MVLQTQVRELASTPTSCMHRWAVIMQPQTFRWKMHPPACAAAAPPPPPPSCAPAHRLEARNTSHKCLSCTAAACVLCYVSCTNFNRPPKYSDYWSTDSTAHLHILVEGRLLLAQCLERAVPAGERSTTRQEVRAACSAGRSGWDGRLPARAPNINRCLASVPCPSKTAAAHMSTDRHNTQSAHAQAEHSHLNTPSPAVAHNQAHALLPAHPAADPRVRQQLLERILCLGGRGIVRRGARLQPAGAAATRLGAFQLDHLCSRCRRRSCCCRGGCGRGGGGGWRVGVWPHFRGALPHALLGHAAGNGSEELWRAGVRCLLCRLRSPAATTGVNCLKPQLLERLLRRYFIQMCISPSLTGCSSTCGHQALCAPSKQRPPAAPLRRQQHAPAGEMKHRHASG